MQSVHPASCTVLTACAAVSPYAGSAIHAPPFARSILLQIESTNARLVDIHMLAAAVQIPLVFKCLRNHTHLGCLENAAVQRIALRLCEENSTFLLSRLSRPENSLVLVRVELLSFQARV